VSSEVPSEKPSAPAPAAPALKRCKCGHDRSHHMVSARNHYSTWGHVVLLLGVSVEPIRVSYECRQCWTVFDETTDPRVLKRQC
jgi:hypothetical protein